MMAMVASSCGTVKAVCPVGRGTVSWATGQPVLRAVGMARVSPTAQEINTTIAEIMEKIIRITELGTSMKEISRYIRFEDG